MPDQFTVPQFIDAENRIMGPITARQFAIMLFVLLTDAVLFRLLRFVPFLLVGIPIFSIGVIFAFIKINGVGFHFFVINIIQTLKKPKLRVWDKRLTDTEVRQYMGETPPPPEAKFKRKPAVSKSRLHELSLVINTGGVYQPESEE